MDDLTSMVAVRNLPHRNGLNGLRVRVVTFELAMAAFPGVLALITFVAGYSRLQQQVKTLEDRLAALADIKTEVAVLAAAAPGTEKAMAHLEKSVDAIGDRMDNFLAAMMGEMRLAMAGRPPVRPSGR